MFQALFYIMLVCFGIGAVAIAKLNSTSDAAQRRARWVKYSAYLVVVGGTVWCIRVGAMHYLAAVLLAVGAYEIISGWRAAHRGMAFLAAALVVYLAIAYGFYRFSDLESRELILYGYTVVFTFDGFAQLTGQLFGRRKILPAISPDKTVAGVVGGYVMGVAIGVSVSQWLSLPGYASWFLPVLICTGAFVGDALASWYKRRCGLKDYSRLIPGHGGVLDRYDSFIVAGAIFWLWCHFF